jgi:hypothetical protein
MSQLLKEVSPEVAFESLKQRGRPSGPKLLCVLPYVTYMAKLKI